MCQECFSGATSRRARCVVLVNPAPGVPIMPVQLYETRPICHNDRQYANCNLLNFDYSTRCELMKTSEQEAARDIDSHQKPKTDDKKAAATRKQQQESSTRK